MAKRKRTYEDTTVPPIAGSFKDAVRALLKVGPAPADLGRPKTAKPKRSAKKKR